MSSGVKHLTVPSDVAIIDTIHSTGPVFRDNTRDPLVISLRQVVVWALEAPSWQANGAARRQADEVAAWAETLTPGAAVSISAERLSMLVAALETRAVIPYWRWISRQLAPHYAALEGATEDPPTSPGTAPQ